MSNKKTFVMYAIPYHTVGEPLNVDVNVDVHGAFALFASSDVASDFWQTLPPGFDSTEIVKVNVTIERVKRN